MPPSAVATAEHEGPSVRWTRGRDGRSRRLVHLLRADPGLARRLPHDELERADSQLVAAALRIPVGRWRPDPGAGRRPLAYLVLQGTLLRSCRVGKRWSTEILGREDVLRPWEETDAIPVETDWQVLEHLQLAVIEQSFTTAAARWPEIIDELLARTVRRSRDLAVLRSVYPIRRLDLRLLILLRLLAGRWGHVSARGVHVGVRLTHESLARLAGAQRPSVSTALARLRRDRLLCDEGRELVLALELPREVEEILGGLS